jgi:hypothetical protein
VLPAALRTRYTLPVYETVRIARGEKEVGMGSGSSLLAAIERDLLDGKPLADLLRKCIMLGGRAGSQELRDWASKELRGYEPDDELPKYRTIDAPILLDGVSGPHRSTGQLVPEGSLPSFVRESGLGEHVDLRSGVGELEAMVAGRDNDKPINIVFPGGNIVGEYFDKASGNPFQHTQRIYWSVVPATIHGLLDNVRTTLTELATELLASVPRDQEVPTAEQADNAFHVAVHGRKSTVTITTSRASGGSTSSVTQQTPRADPAGGEPGWWTFGRTVWAGVVSLFLVAGAIAAIIVIFH